VYSVVTGVAIACSLVIGAASAQQLGRDGGLLPPEESGMVTVAGCLLRGDQIRGGDDDKYVVANLRRPVDSVSEQTCSADAGATAIQLDNPDKGNVNDTMLGRWVIVSGRLERETSNDDILRELDVTAASLVPVEIPRAAAEPERFPEPPAIQAEAPAPAPEASPEPIPVATSGQLPTTASFGPLAGLLGLFACGGGLLLRSLRSRYES
jgi:hypothetical protein